MKEVMVGISVFLLLMNVGFAQADVTAEVDSRIEVPVINGKIYYVSNSSSTYSLALSSTHFTTISGLPSVNPYLTGIMGCYIGEKQGQVEVFHPKELTFIGNGSQSHPLTAGSYNFSVGAWHAEASTDFGTMNPSQPEIWVSGGYATHDFYVEVGS
ncbi:MAG: hypothetical protein NTX57_21650 [Armatimonadetes bacterium]|nr:hypothetical protein [Armatimonadota bacterium]